MRVSFHKEPENYMKHQESFPYINKVPLRAIHINFNFLLWIPFSLVKCSLLYIDTNIYEIKGCEMFFYVSILKYTSWLNNSGSIFFLSYRTYMYNETSTCYMLMATKHDFHKV